MRLLTPWLRKKRYAIAAPYIHGHVLDVGCGLAHTLAAAHGAYTSYTGLERNRERVRLLQQRFPQYAFVQCDLDEDVLETDQTFDTILLLAVLEHLRNPSPMLKQLATALATNGYLIITTPTPFGNHLVLRPGARLGLFSREAVAGHVALYTRGQLENLATQTNLTLETYRRFQFQCNQLAIFKKPQDFPE